MSKGFRCEVVPQDPNDEPASLLLEHIRKEKARKASEHRDKAERKVHQSLSGQTWLDIATAMRN
jgi:type I restriction enzyme S subunit